MKRIYWIGTVIMVIAFFIISLFILKMGNQLSTRQQLPSAVESSASYSQPIDSDTIISEPEQPQEPDVITASATLAAVGDILIHSSIYHDAQTDGGFDFTPMFEKVKPLILSADISFANQETMIGGTELGLSDYPRFNSPFEVGDALKDAGIDIVSMANNHTMDRGEQAILNAINHWKEIGMFYTGAYDSEEDRHHIRTITRNGITFSFLAYSYGTNGLPVPEGKEYLINLIDPEQMKNDVARAKEVSDVVVMSLHFGNEYHRLPDEKQKKLAVQMANEGVDIILGHHPHVLQPVEWITREDGKRTFVIYSLGNFIAAQNGLERELGGIIQLKIEKTTIGDQKSIELMNPVFIPTWAYKSNYRNYDIIPLGEWDKDKLKEVEEEIEAHMTQWMPELAVKDQFSP